MRPTTNATRSRALHRAAPLLLVALSVAGCSEPDPAATETELTRDEFITVLVAIRDAEVDLVLTLDDDSVIDARFQVLRDSILDAHGATQDQIRAFFDAHRDLDYQDALWDTITEALKRAGDETRKSAVPGTNLRSLDMLEPDADLEGPPSLPGRDRPPGEGEGSGGPPDPR